MSCVWLCRMADWVAASRSSKICMLVKYFGRASVKRALLLALGWFMTPLWTLKIGIMVWENCCNFANTGEISLSASMEIMRCKWACGCCCWYCCTQGVNWLSKNVIPCSLCATSNNHWRLKKVRWSKRPASETVGSAASMCDWVILNGLAITAVMAVAVLCSDSEGVGKDIVTLPFVYCQREWSLLGW